MRKFWVRLLLMLAVPGVLFLIIAAQASWRPRTLVTGTPISTLAFAPDGQTLLVGSEQLMWPVVRQNFQLWNVAAGQLQRALPAPPSDLTKVAMSPNAKLIAGLTDGGVIKLWNAQSGQLERTLHRAKTEGLVSVNIAFSPDSKMLVESRGDHGNYTPPYAGQVLLWDIQTGTLRHVLDTGGNTVEKFFFAPDSKTLIGSGRYAAQVWDVARGVLRHKFIARSSLDSTVALSRDGRTLAGIEWSFFSAKPVMLWDIKTGTLKRQLNPSPGRGVTQSVSFTTRRVAHIVFAPDGSTVATVSNETGVPPGVSSYNGPGVPLKGEVTLWDSQTGAARYTFRNNDNPLGIVAFSPDSRLIAVGSDREVMVWETATGKLWRKLPAQREPISALAFTPDGGTLATGSAEQVKLWRIQ